MPTKSKMNVPYVEKDSAEEHLREIRSNVIITSDMVESNGNLKCMFHQSRYQYGGIRSAINHVYILARVQIPERMKKELSIFIAGMKRTLIVEKQMLGIKFYEGKKTITLKAYDLLTKTLFESGEKRDIFAHLFIVLDWCLMKGAEIFVNAKINHIHFHGDCLVFEFKKSKVIKREKII